MYFLYFYLFNYHLIADATYGGLDDWPEMIFISSNFRIQSSNLVIFFIPHIWKFQGIFRLYFFTLPKIEWSLSSHLRNHNLLSSQQLAYGPTYGTLLIVAVISGNLVNGSPHKMRLHFLPQLHIGSHLLIVS